MQAVGGASWLPVTIVPWNSVLVMISSIIDLWTEFNEALKVNGDRASIACRKMTKQFWVSCRAFFKDFSLGVQKFLISKFLIVS
jgi:hypothetical protein